MELNELLESIRQAIVKIIDDANTGARAINYGDRVRVSNLKPPVIWILPTDSNIAFSGMGEIWEFRFAVAAVIKETDPVKGRKRADDMAAKASSSLVRSRTLGGIVRNVKRIQYLATDTAGMSASDLFSAGYMMEAEFRYLEREA